MTDEKLNVLRNTTALAREMSATEVFALLVALRHIDPDASPLSRRQAIAGAVSHEHAGAAIQAIETWGATSNPERARALEWVLLGALAALDKLPPASTGGSVIGQARSIQPSESQLMRIARIAGVPASEPGHRAAFLDALLDLPEIDRRVLLARTEIPKLRSFAQVALMLKIDKATVCASETKALAIIRRAMGLPSAAVARASIPRPKKPTPRASSPTPKPKAKRPLSKGRQLSHFSHDEIQRLAAVAGADISDENKVAAFTARLRSLKQRELQTVYLCHASSQPLRVEHVAAGLEISVGEVREAKAAALHILRGSAGGERRPASDRGLPRPPPPGKKARPSSTKRGRHVQVQPRPFVRWVQGGAPGSGKRA